MYCFRGLLCGHTVVVMERFDAASALHLVQEHRVQFAMVVPTMMQRIWRLPDRTSYDVSSLRTVLHLGAPCPPWLKRAWLDWLGPDRVLELYAGTEGNGITVITGREWLEHPGSVGRPALGSAVRVLHPETRADQPVGEVGEVFLRPADGPGTTYRYVGATATSVDGWETLGDLGFLDADGYLHLTDRSADLVVTGGSNVYPAEVEAALDSHPAVRSSCVVGLPDDDLGERVHALVDAPGGVDVDELLAHVGARLVRYKVPRTVELVDGPLRDDAGKVRRSALRAERLTDR
jgi:bile acid-coenzyme A ligase